MTLTISPPSSVLLVVGREEFTPPRTFGGRACTATGDCLAVAVAAGAPVELTLAPAPDTSGLVALGRYEIETEGLLSVRDVYSREYDTMGTAPGRVAVTVWGDDEDAPARVALQVAPADRPISG